MPFYFLQRFIVWKTNYRGSNDNIKAKIKATFYY